MVCISYYESLTFRRIYCSCSTYSICGMNYKNFYHNTSSQYESKWFGMIKIELKGIFVSKIRMNNIYLQTFGKNMNIKYIYVICILYTKMYSKNKLVKWFIFIILYCSFEIRDFPLCAILMISHTYYANR